jgi:hypothetical protein
MQTIKYLAFIVLLGAVNSCIDRFYVEDYSDDPPKIVINGSIIQNSSEQVISISYTSSTEYPFFYGISNCSVEVVDSNYNSFRFYEDPLNPGQYKAIISQENLGIGNSFQLIVETPAGNLYKSSFETLMPSPPVDSIYYLLEHHETSTAGEYIDGLQFYIDFEAPDNYGNYYHWIVEETYEYHSTWNIGRYYDPYREITQSWADIPRFVCYRTYDLSNILLLSTEGLVENKYKKAKLQFVDDHSQRLLHNYSILIKQRSIGKEEYVYWSTIKKNNQETDGLYTKQPAMPKGNIYNENDPKELVLGYFSACSETYKRIVIERPPELKFKDVGLCDAQPLGGPLPKMLIFFVDGIGPDGKIVEGYTTRECVDCTVHGGVLEKPPFFK